MWTDPAAVARQYHDATNLNARRAIHERFSTNPGDLPRWLFDHLRATVADRAGLLELGAGPGEFWRRNRDRLPADWRVTLTDISPGMVEAAQSALGPRDGQFTFATVDAQAIPAPAATYDAVIAHFMLYHVADVPRAVAESRRVLRPGGVLHAAANGAAHLARARELLAAVELAEPPDVRDASAAGDAPAFRLENGESLLRAQFAKVTLYRWEDSLAVTEVAPLLSAMLSGIDAQQRIAALGPDRAGDRIAALAATLQAELDREGVIRIGKDTGLFVARPERG